MPLDSVGVPRFPEPPKEWNDRWMSDFIRVLSSWLVRAIAESDEELGETSIELVTADRAMGPRDGFLLVDTTGGNVLITLPTPSRALIARPFVVKRISGGSNTLTVVPPSGTIDDASSVKLMAQYDTLRVVCDGTDFWINGGASLLTHVWPISATLTGSGSVSATAS